MMLAATTYPDSVHQWRAEHEKKISAETGWLSYAGLFWLKEGENHARLRRLVPLPLRQGAIPRRRR